MRPYSYTIPMIILRERMPATGAYYTVKSTTSSMDDKSLHLIEYRSYWLSMPVVFYLKDIMGLSIFVSGGNKERKNGALKVLEVAIIS